MKSTTTILGLVLCGFGFAALAQGGPGPEAGPEMGMNPGMEAGAHWDPQKMKERMARHAKELHDKLKLNPDQDKAWQTMEDAMKPPAEQKKPLDIADLEKLTAPERMEKMLERLKQHEQVMQTRLKAVKAFYAKLDSDQRKVFDEETLAPWKKLAEMRRDRKADTRP